MRMCVYVQTAHFNINVTCCFISVIWNGQLIDMQALKTIAQWSMMDWTAWLIRSYWTLHGVSSNGLLSKSIEKAPCGACRNIDRLCGNQCDGRVHARSSAVRDKGSQSWHYPAGRILQHARGHCYSKSESQASWSEIRKTGNQTHGLKPSKFDDQYVILTQRINLAVYSQPVVIDWQFDRYSVFFTLDTAQLWGITS